MLNKLNAFILCFIFLSVTPLKAGVDFDSLPSDQLSVSHSARVTVTRAVVYSDENLSSPLGYISKDKLITVGNPRKKNPEIIPLVVAGHLAFIEAKNIIFENETKDKHAVVREHNIDILLAKPEEKLLENNSAFISLHEYSGGDQLKLLTNAVDGTSKDNLFGYDLSIIHRQSTGYYFWGASYEYSALSTDSVKLSNYMMGPVFGFTPFKNQLFTLDFILSMDFSISSELEIKNNYSTKAQGFVWGPQVGSRVVFFPYLKYHAFGTLGYRSYKVLEINSFLDSSGASVNGITKMNGINLSIGVAFEI